MILDKSNRKQVAYLKSSATSLVFASNGTLRMRSLLEIGWPSLIDFIFLSAATFSFALSVALCDRYNQSTQNRNVKELIF